MWFCNACISQQVFVWSYGAAVTFQLFTLPKTEPHGVGGVTLPGSKCHFYVTGTTTRQDTYSNSTLTTPHANPVVADANGVFEPIYLDPTKIYKLTLTTSADALIYTVDPCNDVVLTTASLVALLTRSVLGGIIYPENALETSLSIAVVNSIYPYGDVDRYGTNTTPDTTDMTAAFNAAFKYAKNSGHDVTYGRTWPYRLTGPIDATQDAGTNQYGYSVRNIGQVSAATNTAPTYTCIRANHTGHVFDCTGAIAINWYDASVGTVTGGSEPQTVWFCARNSAGSSTFHRWNNCRFLGKVSIAVRYRYGIEENDSHGDFFYNDTTTAGSCIDIITSNNISGLSSTFVTIATGPRSQRACRHFGGSYIMPAGSATSDVFRLDQAEHVYLRDPFMANTGRSYVFSDPTNGPSNFCHVSGLESENGVEPAYAICFGAAGSTSTPTGWTITESYLRADTRAIFAGANVVLDNFKVNSITEAANRGIEAVTAQGCSFDTATAIVLTTSSANTLTGDPSNWTITTQTGDYWNDKRASHNWTYSSTGITFTGAVTSTSKLYASGQEIRANIVVSAATSIVCAAGATIDGLTWPSLASNYSPVSVVNIATGVAIPGGYVNGTTIVLPAINVGVNVPVLISATYLRTA
jgi:hypothetical protein